MKAFRFRAASILDLRRREEDEARSTLARANAVQHTAAERVQAAAQAAEAARGRLGEVFQSGAPAWLLGWHQSWMTKQRLDLDARRRDLAGASAAVATANTALREAYRRRRVLERLRDRAWQRYQNEARRQELREMDLLAGLRYLARASEHEGARSEHE